MQRRYHKMKVTTLKENLLKMGYAVSIFDTKEEACAYLTKEIKGTSVGFGGSMTAREMGLAEALAKENEDLTSYIIGTISAGEPLESPMRRIRGCDAKWFSGITYEIRKRVRHEILNTTNEDLLALTGAVRKALDSASVCVIGPEDALKRCGIETIYSIS